MLDKQQTQILLGSGVLVLILAIVILSSKTDFLFKGQPTTTGSSFNKAEEQAYLKYLASLEIDQQASAGLFKELITEADIQKEVEAELAVNQQIIKPAVESEFLASEIGSSKESVTNYIANLLGSVLNYNTHVGDLDQDLFGKSQDLNKIFDQHTKLYSELYSLPAPTEARVLRDTLIVAHSAYKTLLSEAIEYKAEGNSSPWPSLYANYTIINDELKKVDQEVEALTSKYQIANTPITPVYAFGDNNNFRLIKRAHALFGIGDVSITIGDIPRIIKEAVEEGLTASFAQFMGVMLNKLIEKIESNYRIANFLYYTDALIAGQYTDDYLEKYIVNQVDRQIIKRFIPQFTCGISQHDLGPIFLSKAQDYLGFNADDLDPRDPDYYNKLAKFGDFMASPYGWEQYYEGVAKEAQSEAEKAAERELTSPGIKTPRDTVNSAIAISVNNIISASRASLNAIMKLGITSAKILLVVL
jgi:hypothetical protein